MLFWGSVATEESHAQDKRFFAEFILSAAEGLRMTVSYLLRDLASFGSSLANDENPV